MKKYTSNSITSDNTSLHSTPQGAELTPQALQDFFQKISDNASAELFRFVLHPDLDNPSQPLQIRGVWNLEEAIADSSRITSLEYHFSLDGSFTDIGASPYSSLTDLNAAIAINVASESTFWYLKVGGTISATNQVDVFLRMINTGTAV